jgi:predicted RNase H-like nuclease (RuvC/YqgF family)
VTERRSTDPVTEPEDDLSLDRMQLRHDAGTALCSRPAAECHRERDEALERLRTHDGWCDAVGQQPYLVEALREARAEVERLQTANAAGDLELQETIDENERLRAALAEACDEYDEASHYKGIYLREKHGDADTLTRLRAVAGRS